MDFQAKVTYLKQQQVSCQLSNPYTDCKNLLRVKQNSFFLMLKK